MDFVTYVRILEQTNKLEEELSKGFEPKHWEKVFI